MLSPSEVSGIKELLNFINDEELFSVLETVTKRMFTTRRRQDAIEKILKCTDKPSDLLRRQKITKKILFNYLVQKGQVALAEWGKPALAKKCLELWCSTEPCKESDYVDEQITVKNEKNNLVPPTSLMGIEFSRWFFKIYNELSEFGPEHFWPNCHLYAQLLSPSGPKDVTVSGDMNVAVFLSNLVRVDKFYFCANESSDYILVEEEPHGLVKIMIKGVLYQYSNCVGLFDSAFGLVKNPNFENTYKIQVLHLKMQVNTPTEGILPAGCSLPIHQTPQNYNNVIC